MFHSARITLTAWYLLIIMAISIAFSGVIYIGSTSEYGRVLRMQKLRSEHPEFQFRILQGNQVQILQETTPFNPDPQVLEDAEMRLLERLIGVNIIILVLSAVAGYFLAGRTLRPIKQMVDDQNRFITDASHELNTPLTSLRTGIEVNLRDKKLTLAKARAALGSNLEEVESLQLLSADLIKLTQYRQASGAFPFEIISLKKVVQAAVEKTKILASSKQIAVRPDVLDVLLHADEKSMIELFVVLLDNAIKYSPEKTTVSIKTKRIDGKVEIQVTDHGIGIDKKDLPHIFDRFYRADKSRTKQSVSGYGLGLSIAKRVVEFHKGTISVNSIVGQGTTFSLVFPVVKKS